MPEKALVQRLLPDVGVEPLEELYLDLDVPTGDERPHVYLDMVSSADGAATVAGRTVALGGPADELAFSRLRETCDAILVGAGTVRIEDYGPPRTREGGRDRRRSRGLAPVPTIVVVTASGDLDPASRLFSDAERRPVVLAPDDLPGDRRSALERVADVVAVGHGRVDLAAGLAALTRRGWRRVLCEGGPHLNRELFDADLVDELFLTVTPAIVGASGHRIVDGAFRGAPRALQLRELRLHGSEMLLRYRVAR